jgi:hypothetical protein
MPSRAYVDTLNRSYFEGRLAPAVVERLSALPVARDDVRAFVERMFRMMQRSGFAASDLSTLHGDVLGGLLARLLPETWSGRVPPITLAGRHRKIDELVSLRAAQNGSGPGVFLDVACGFPPLTTIETADALPDWQIVGLDPALPTYLVHDDAQNHALFDAAGRATYFQPVVPTAENWFSLLEDWQRSRDRFESLLESLLVERARQGGDAERFEYGGAVLETRPEATYERPNLRFVRGDLEAAPHGGADVVRCFNMLYYFDDGFRVNALATFSKLLRDGGLLVAGGDWAYTTECRYFTYVKRGDRLEPSEFAFSLDNVSPLAILPWYTLHDDTREVLLLARLVGELRRDQLFLKACLAVGDSLRASCGVCPRGADGYYEGVASHVPPAEVWQRGAQISEGLASPELAAMAVDILARAGFTARVNEVGHIAIAIDE